VITGDAQTDKCSVKIGPQKAAKMFYWFIRHWEFFKKKFLVYFSPAHPSASLHLLRDHQSYSTSNSMLITMRVPRPVHVHQFLGSVMLELRGFRQTDCICHLRLLATNTAYLVGFREPQNI